MDEAEYQQMLAVVTDLEAKYAAPAASPPPGAAAAFPSARVAFWHIAHLCARALKDPALSAGAKLYVLQIAKVCMRFLKR